MLNSALIAVTIAGAIVSVFLLVAAATSHHKKSGTGDVHLLGASGLTNTKLDPEGTVLIHGELWRARSSCGLALDQNRRVRVVGLRGHLLVVEPCD